jgi:hypothetical protein
VETHWLIGPKSSYTVAIDQEPYRTQEDRHSAVGQHQASIYDTSNRQGMDGNQSEDRLTPSKRLSNVLNRRPSIVGGQCPFSAQRNGIDT